MGFDVAAQGVLHMGFVCRLTGRRTRAGYFIGYLFLLFGVQGACSAAGWGTPPALAMALAALYGMSRLALGNGPARSCAAAVLAVCVCRMAMGTVNSLESLAAPWTASRPMYGVIVLAALAAPALCALCYGLALRLLSLEEDGPYSGLLPVLGLFFFAAELYILETAYAHADGTAESAGKHLALLGLQVLGVLALLCTLYAYRRACRGARDREALASQRIYVEEARARYEKTRSFRHDLQNHLSVLDGLLAAGRAEEARRYLQRLETRAAELSPRCRTGNPAVDVLLGEKLARAEGVDAEVCLCLPEGRAVDSFDLCVIFANALDNALLACREGGDKAFLRIRDSRQGDFYCLEFENSCAAGPPPKPGTGLRNIRAVAEKYGGVMDFRQDGERFRLEVLLNISER